MEENADPASQGDDESKSGTRRAFAENLDQTLIAMPLIQRIEQHISDMGEVAGRRQPIDVILDLNLLYPLHSGLESARTKAREITNKALANIDVDVETCRIDMEKSRYAHQNIFARLTANQIFALLEACEGGLRGQDARPIYKIWHDAEIESHMDKSISTVKADAAYVAFSASGEGVCWAVIDSGIDGEHDHFEHYSNLELPRPLHHMDFSGDGVKTIPRDQNPVDESGHGTHVAGIIAGAQSRAVDVVSRVRDDQGGVSYRSRRAEGIRSIAPACKLVSLRVLNKQGRGKVSNLIAAMGYIDKINSGGRWRLIHGVNMSVGYEFEAEWFACGQSPLCVEVNRLVKSGVSVVVAAGNTGYGFAQAQEGAFKTGLDLTINDPGNAELAITVGSTHKEHPHTYGVSYFSSKGPTGDGRLKPDLVAPGERIVSCAAGAAREQLQQKEELQDSACEYREESGTSMAAPHVSGAIAAFLSIRQEFVGEPEKVKEIFLRNCTDLGRDRYFQGHGLLDLMRAIQSV